MTTAGRLPFDELFLQIAELVAKRGTCNRLQVGCVIVKDNRVVSMGYNGSSPGQPHCLDEGCLIPEGQNSGCIRTIHSESNAIAWAARAGVSVEGATIFLTHDPCRECCKLIASSGIIKVVFRAEYGRNPGLHLLNQQGIEVQHGVE